MLTNTDKEVIKRGGYGKIKGLGEKPVVIVIDIQYNYSGENKPILEQIEKWPSGCGEEAWRAVNKTEILLKEAREIGVPIIYTRNVQKTIDFDCFSSKTNRNQSKYLDGHFGTKIVDIIAPKKGDLVIDKAYPSAFFGTPLISWLIKLGVDTLLVAGGTTSGCVRATVIDAVSRNYNVAVIEDCVFDRIQLSHKAGLFDIWMKYADVINLDEALDYLSYLKKQNV